MDGKEVSITIKERCFSRHFWEIFRTHVPTIWQTTELVWRYDPCLQLTVTLNDPPRIGQKCLCITALFHINTWNKLYLPLPLPVICYDKFAWDTKLDETVIIFLQLEENYAQVLIVHSNCMISIAEHWMFREIQSKRMLIVNRMEWSLRLVE